MPWPYDNNKYSRTGSAFSTTTRIGHDNYNKPPSASIQNLFDADLTRVLQSVFIQLSLYDLDRCRLVSRQWNAFLKDHVWGNKSCANVLRPKYEKLLYRNWFHSKKPDVTHTFRLGQRPFKHVNLATDRDVVVVSLGNAEVLVWNRRTMEKKRIFLWKKKMSGLNVESEAPLLALGKEALVVYFQVEMKIRVFDRERDYDEVDQKDISSDFKKCKGLFLLDNVFVLASDKVLKIFSYNCETRSLDEEGEIVGPEDTGITSVCIDDNSNNNGRRLIYVGDAANLKVDYYDIADTSSLAGSVSTASTGPANSSLSPDMMASSWPLLAVATNQGSSVAIRSCFTVFSLDLEGAKQRLCTVGYPFPDVLPMGCQYDMQMRGTRLVVACFGKDGLAVFYHLYNLADVVERKWVDEDRALYGFFSGSSGGPERRFRYPVFKLEEDCLVVGDEMGDVVVMEYWRPRKEKRRRDRRRNKEEEEDARNWRR